MRTSASVQAVECSCTLGPTRSSRLSESRRIASEAASGSTATSRLLREAAKAVARASTPSFLRACPASCVCFAEHPQGFGRDVCGSRAPVLQFCASHAECPEGQFCEGPAGEAVCAVAC